MTEAARAGGDSAPDITTNNDKSIAGIAEPEWLDWFTNEIDHCSDPWNEWLKHQRFPRGNPLNGWLEFDIKDLIKAADILRQTTVPQTKTFKAQYETFRKHHEELDCRGKYRRQRYMVWRAAALTVICDRDRFQDDVDRRQVWKTLAATMQFFGPVDVYGNYNGGNIWRPGRVTFSDGREGLDPASEYTSVVLLLMRQAIKSPAIMQAAFFWKPEAHPIPTGFTIDSGWMFKDDRWVPYSTAEEAAGAIKGEKCD